LTKALASPFQSLVLRSNILRISQADLSIVPKTVTESKKQDRERDIREKENKLKKERELKTLLETSALVSNAKKNNIDTKNVVNHLVSQSLKRKREKLELSFKQAHSFKYENSHKPEKKINVSSIRDKKRQRK